MSIIYLVVAQTTTCMHACMHAYIHTYIHTYIGHGSVYKRKLKHKGIWVKLIFSPMENAPNSPYLFIYLLSITVYRGKFI